VPVENATKPFAFSGNSDAVVCDLTKSLPTKEAWTMPSTGTPLKLTATFFKPYDRIDKIEVNFLSGSYAELKNAIPEPATIETERTRGHDAYWIKGDLITRLGCWRSHCSLVSGRNLEESKRLLSEFRSKASKDEAKQNREKAMMDAFNKK